MNYSSYETLVKTTRYWLQGKAENDSRYFTTLKALNVALRYHQGTRKDGVTKEVYHQLAIFSLLRTLSGMMIEPHMVLSVALLHDTYEDYPVSHRELANELPEVYPYLIRISKVRNESKIGYDVYFGEMQECSVTSIVKIADRIHNLSTMSNAFSIEKQKSYIEEVREYFHPLIKYARRKFPEQENVYENLKSILYMLIDNIETRI